MNEPQASSSLDRKVDIVDERLWHIGKHVRALDSFGAMGKVYGGFPAYRYRRLGIEQRQLVSFPVAAVWNKLCSKVHLPQWLGLNEPQIIGTWAASRVESKYVCSYGTAYQFLFPRLVGTDRIRILESGSSHAEDHFHKNEWAKKEAGFPYSEKLPNAIAHEVEQAKLAHFIAVGSGMVGESFTKRGYPAERILRCDYGVDSDRFAYFNRPVAKGRPLRIASVGIVGLRKGILRLIRMNEWAKSRGFDVEVWVIGPVSPEARILLSQTSAPFRICGVQKGAALVEALHQCDLYAMASYEEGFPISMVEAMSTGLPVIASNDTGAREAVTVGGNGVILKDFTHEEMDQVLGPLFAQPGQLAAMQGASRQTVEKTYTLRHYDERIRSEYTRMFEMVESAGPGGFPSCFENWA